MIFNKEQLSWFEEMNPDMWVCLLIQPAEINNPNNPSPLLKKFIRIKDVKTEILPYSSENIWRSWCIYKDEAGLEKLGAVPLVFDIDDESNPANIPNSYELTRVCIEILQSRRDVIGSGDDIRVVFSGKKGFHIELKPLNPLDAKELRRDLVQSCVEVGLKHISHNIFFEKTSIDTINIISKPWIRVTDTISSWRNKTGEIIKRRIFQLSLSEFMKHSAEDIVLMSQLGLDIDREIL